MMGSMTRAVALAAQLCAAFRQSRWRLSRYAGRYGLAAID
jgi:hypothetical protein